MAIKIFLLIWLVQLQMYYFYWHHTWDRLWTDRHKNSRWQLGSYIFLALPFFYASTGCDISPSFCGKGKCKAYTVWVKSDRNDDFTDVFVELRETPKDVKSDHSDMLQSLVLQLYGSRHDLHLVPPSKEELHQHIYCAFYQTGHLRRQSVEELDIPGPEQWS